MGQLFWKFDAARAPVETLRAVGNVSPAFQEDAALSIVLQNLEAAFEAHKIAPRFASFARDLNQRFGALARSTHQLFVRRRRGAHTALDFHSDNFEIAIRNEFCRESVQGVRNGPELRLASAADGDDDFLHEAQHSNALIVTRMDQEYHV